MKNEKYHLMRDDEAQRTVFACEVTPENAHYKLSVAVIKFANKYNLKSFGAELAKDKVIAGGK